ncbi:hypothetical protein E2C01_044824 [Portunus trituberculatus]|uniref:Uncharacterized protein n=1 Tax=Portunus trituberculatus TaxID=210409 RepID=A0A5B7G0I4_PORTR|nr:hypothetical protein [Portunus trituberculatus]
MQYVASSAATQAQVTRGSLEQAAAATAAAGDSGSR